MACCMMHEPFYTSGIYSVPGLGIYAGWVAHENSFAAGQAFFNEEGDMALLFSGECLADPNTRTALSQKGRRLERDDGDRLVQLYEEEGNRFFEKLNGLFSGLLIDKRRRKTFLFNDRYGVERIYYHETADAFYFATEAKALLRVLPELRAFDEEGVAHYLNFGCTLEQRTLFRNIQLVPGGALWTFEDGKCHKKKYFSQEAWESQSILSTEAFQAEFERTFQRVLPRYFQSRTRVGISLTAGLDGRMIMACRPDMADAPICYTYCGQERETLDVQLAARVADACGLEHRILRIGPDFFSDFASHVDRTVYVTDGYLGSLGAHEIYMSRQGRQLAPVRLTGVFGGEILRGVSMFKPFRLSPGLVNPDLGPSPSSFGQGWKLNEQHPVSFAAFSEIPMKRFGTPAASRSQVIFRTPYLDNEIVALAYRTPESVRRSATPALEFIKNADSALNNIPTDMGSMGETRGVAAALRRFFSKVTFKLDYLQNEGLPHWMSGLDPLLTQLNSSWRVFGQHKFLHYRRWFRRELADYVSAVLQDRQTRCSSLWNPDFLRGLAREHILGHKNYVLEIDAVLTLAAVERLLFHNFPCEPEPPALSISGTAVAPI